MIWPELWNSAKYPKSMIPEIAVFYALFLNFSFLVIVSPFMKNVWPKSLWAWWGGVIVSGLASAAS